MPGRRPIPSHLKILRGTARPDRMNSKEPRLTPYLPTRAPKGMSAEAKEKWRELAPDLYQSGLLTALDLMALELLCHSWGVYVRAQRLIDEEGVTYRVGDRIKLHPAHSIAANAWQQVRAMLTEFGCTPASRSKVEAIEAPKISKLSRYVNNGKKTEVEKWDEFLEEEKQQAMDERFFGSPESA